MTTPILSSQQMHQPFEYKAGDRVCATFSGRITPAQYKKICKSIDEFCKVPVNTLVVDPIKISIVGYIRERAHVYVNFSEPKLQKPGIVNLNCMKIEFQKGETVMVFHRSDLSKQSKDGFKRWVGDENEVRFVPV